MRTCGANRSHRRSHVPVRPHTHQERDVPPRQQLHGHRSVIPVCGIDAYGHLTLDCGVCSGVVLAVGYDVGLLQPLHRSARLRRHRLHQLRKLCKDYGQERVRRRHYDLPGPAQLCTMQADCVPRGKLPWRIQLPRRHAQNDGMSSRHGLLRRVLPIATGDSTVELYFVSTRNSVADRNARPKCQPFWFERNRFITSLRLSLNASECHKSPVSTTQESTTDHGVKPSLRGCCHQRWSEYSRYNTAISVFHSAFAIQPSLVFCHCVILHRIVDARY